jgi:ribosomal-protein-alanine N-acetyltransferase
MTQAEAEEMAGWRYPGEYGFYDADFLDDDLGELLEPAQRGDMYYAAHAADGAFEGFAELKPLRDGAAEIGLGLRPDLTGRGLGAELTLAVVDLMRAVRRPQRVTLAVAAFNVRAIWVYERVGFVEAGRHVRTFAGRDWEFVDMELR